MPIKMVGIRMAITRVDFGWGFSNVSWTHCFFSVGVMINRLDRKKTITQANNGAAFQQKEEGRSW